ncbi:MAG: methionine--tRNA ligase subunit beta [Candidatus Sungbacteria bacterium]|nr:methionine--tRNA ligase subunit beta [Candidatus Sungbacteria bacterium]
MALSIEDFKKLDLRIGRILAAEAVEGSEKLVRLRVDIGSEERQVLAGIAKYYTPIKLLGRSIVVVANLEPRVLMGYESQGMMLAANADGPVILVPEREVPAGTEVR